MTLRILAVGKVKEKFYREAIQEYMKRLRGYARVEICEAADEKTPESASAREKEVILKKEGDRILGQIRESDYVIALAIDGRAWNSEDFSEHLSKLMMSGAGTIDFVIGGSLGLDPEVLERADERLSFSAFTFPHQLMRVILLEQIYRAFRIMRHEPYHK